MKLIPASSAAWMIRIESSWSGLPHSPNIIAPRQSELTSTPVRPRSRYSTRETLLVDLTCGDGHEGRRDRAPDRGGDRLRGPRARVRAPSGAALGAVRRQPHARPGGAPPALGARVGLVRAEPRLP